jgi:hypothetical protein
MNIYEYITYNPSATYFCAYKFEKKKKKKGDFSFYWAIACCLYMQFSVIASCHLFSWLVTSTRPSHYTLVGAYSIVFHNKKCSRCRLIRALLIVNIFLQRTMEAR